MLDAENKINILDHVLFESGEAELKPPAATVLRKVSGVLAQHPNIKVHGIGHTDNVPIKAAPAIAALPSPSSPKNWPARTPLRQPRQNPLSCAVPRLQPPTLWLIHRLGPAPPRSMFLQRDKFPAAEARVNSPASLIKHYNLIDTRPNG